MIQNLAIALGTEQSADNYDEQGAKPTKLYELKSTECTK
jgi:hypothetical protein